MKPRRFPQQLLHVHTSAFITRRATVLWVECVKIDFGWMKNVSEYVLSGDLYGRTDHRAADNQTPNDLDVTSDAIQINDTRMFGCEMFGINPFILAATRICVSKWIREIVLTGWSFHLEELKPVGSWRILGSRRDGSRVVRRLWGQSSISSSWSFTCCRMWCLRLLF